MCGLPQVFGEPLVYNVRVDKVTGRLPCLQHEGQQSYWEVPSFTMGGSTKGLRGAIVGGLK